MGTDHFNNIRQPNKKDMKRKTSESQTDQEGNGISAVTAIIF